MNSRSKIMLFDRLRGNRRDYLPRATALLPLRCFFANGVGCLFSLLACSSSALFLHGRTASKGMMPPMPLAIHRTQVCQSVICLQLILVMHNSTAWQRNLRDSGPVYIKEELAVQNEGELLLSLSCLPDALGPLPLPLVSWLKKSFSSTPAIRKRLKLTEVLRQILAPASFKLQMIARSLSLPETYNSTVAFMIPHGYLIRHCSYRHQEDWVLGWWMAGWPLHGCGRT